MSFSELKEYINTRRDIEFEYKGIKCSISNSSDGYIFAEFNNSDSIKIFSTPQELINKVCIRNKSLEEICEEFICIEVF